MHEKKSNNNNKNISSNNHTEKTISSGMIWQQFVYQQESSPQLPDDSREKPRLSDPYAYQVTTAEIGYTEYLVINIFSQSPNSKLLIFNKTFQWI